MWIFTQDGYISVVQHFNPTPGAELLMRSRSAGHLYDLLCLVLTEEEVDDRVLVTPDHDYPYRILVSRELFGQVVAASMARLDYSNFKARCSQTLGGADAGVLNRDLGGHARLHGQRGPCSHEGPRQGSSPSPNLVRRPRRCLKLDLPDIGRGGWEERVEYEMASRIQRRPTPVDLAPWIGKRAAHRRGVAGDERGGRRVA